MAVFLPHRLFRQSWTKVLGTAWKYGKCSLIALFSKLWRVAFAQSDVPPSPWSMLLRESALSAHWYNIERGGGRGKSKRGDFERKSAGVPTLLSRIVGWVWQPCHPDIWPSGIDQRVKDDLSWVRGCCLSDILEWSMLEARDVGCAVFEFHAIDYLIMALWLVTGRGTLDRVYWSFTMFDLKCKHHTLQAEGCGGKWMFEDDSQGFVFTMNSDIWVSRKAAY